MPTPVSPFNPIVVNRVEIVPFTYRDGATYLEVLKTMSTYLIGISNTFTDALNATIENGELINEKVIEFTEYVDSSIAIINTKIIEIDNSIAESKEYVDTQVAAMLEIVNDAVSGFDTRFNAISSDVAALGIQVDGVSQSLTALTNDLPNIIASEIASPGSPAGNNTMQVVKAQINENKISTDTAIDAATARVVGQSAPASATRQAILDLVGGEVGGTPASQSEVNNNVDVNKYLTPRTVNGFVDFLRGNRERDEANIDIPVSFNVNAINAPVGTRLTIPTPANPAGGQVTHPSVVYSPDKFGGYLYWLAYTPYAGGNDALEDPCIAVSNDGINWSVPTGLTNPLDDAPGGTLFNSDPALVFGDNGYLYCFWRQVNNTTSTETIYYRRTKDGVNWEPKVVSRSAPFASNRLVSPAYIYDNGVWTMFAVNVQPVARPVVMLTATGSPTGWSAPVTCAVPTKAGRDNWHIEVRYIGGQYVGILADCETGTNGVNGDLYLITSQDGLNWSRAASVLVPRVNGTEHNALYRSTFVPEFISGVLSLRLIYAGWVNATPTVWNLFRTAAIPIAPGSFEQNGTLATVLVPAGTNVNHSLTFPVPFDNIPFIDYFHDSSRLTIAVIARSVTGVTFAVSNWTSAQASPGSLVWRAR